jgi:hypothetical protein
MEKMTRNLAALYLFVDETVVSPCEPHIQYACSFHHYFPAPRRLARAFASPALSAGVAPSVPATKTTLPFYKTVEVHKPRSEPRW